MIKMIVTKASISKGYEDRPALRFSDSTENPSVRFRVGVKVYDKKAENERRFVNINVKAFGYLADRIKNMKLEAGSLVNIIGRYDIETWEDKNTQAQRSEPVLIVDEIEYGAPAQNGRESQNEKAQKTSASTAKGKSTKKAPAANSELPDNFTGFESFDGANPFYPES